MHTTLTPSPDHNTHSSKSPVVKPTESSPCTSDFRSFEIDYDEISECSESNVDSSQKKCRTAKGNEMSPSKMPLMRIRSVEIVFEDEMSTCTDTGLLGRSMELMISDSSDDSTKCIDELENLPATTNNDNDNSVTLNADDDLTDDNSVALVNNIEIDQNIDIPEVIITEIEEINIENESLTLPNNDISSSLIASEVGDSGRFTEETSSSHFETVFISTCEDAVLSKSMDAINYDEKSAILSKCEIPDVFNVNDECKPKLLFEYIGSDSDSSDDTAVCETDSSNNCKMNNITSVIDDSGVCDSSDIQYDSFVDMGKF